MKTIVNELRLLNDNEEVLCKLDSVTHYDESIEFDEGETFFIHPMTGSECQIVSQCLDGWSEQDEESQEQWEKLIEAIQTDVDLSQKIFDMDVIYYFA